MAPATFPLIDRTSTPGAVSPGRKGAADPDADGAAGKLQSVCAEFESIFLSRLFAAMRATVPQDGLFGGGPAEELFTSMRDAEMARELTAQRGFGLARMLVERLSQGPAEGPGAGAEAAAIPQNEKKGSFDGD